MALMMNEQRVAHMPHTSDDTLSPRMVAADLNGLLPAAELAKLYRSIESGMPTQSPQAYVVQFTSSYPSEGAHRIAYETALFAAMTTRRNVLFIDSGIQSCLPASVTQGPDASLDKIKRLGKRLSDAVVTVTDSTFSYAKLSEPGKSKWTFTDFATMEQAVLHLRRFYDLIVLDSGPILHDGLGASLARLADGAVLVVKAEWTRAPVVEQAQQTLLSHGGHLIGSVLSNRRFPIPRWIYRLLYRRG